MKRDTERVQARKSVPSGDRMLTLRLPPPTYTFLLEESAELALARGEDPRAVERERRSVEARLATGQGKSRGLLVFSDVVSNAIEVLRTYAALPDLVRGHLERDRRALAKRTGVRYSRFRYLQHVLYSRSEDVVRAGAGFDAGVVSGSGSGRRAPGR